MDGEKREDAKGKARWESAWCYTAFSKFPESPRLLFPRHDHPTFVSEKMAWIILCAMTKATAGSTREFFFSRAASQLAEFMAPRRVKRRSEALFVAAVRIYCAACDNTIKRSSTKKFTENVLGPSIFYLFWRENRETIKPWKNKSLLSFYFSLSLSFMHVFSSWKTPSEILKENSRNVTFEIKFPTEQDRNRITGCLGQMYQWRH